MSKSEKLTLRLDRTLIARAKAYARSRGKSVSSLVSDYFALLQERPEGRRPKPASQDGLPPITRSLRGALRGSQIDERDYREYLERKFG